jgi:osomolarity two-component system response regulator SSK1
MWNIRLTISQPVNFVWLERKVMEWGCMQALIDFDGWRKWKDFSQSTTNHDAEKENKSKALEKKKKKNRASLGSVSQASNSRVNVAGIREEASAVAT